MNRQDKIKILQAIEKGRLSAHSLNGPQIYLFYESTHKPGTYTMEGKEFTRQEYEAFCQRIKETDKRKDEPDIVLTLSPAKSCDLSKQVTL